MALRLFNRALPTLRQSVTSATQPHRNFNLHEYQSKALMDKFNINVQRWRLVETVDQAAPMARELKTSNLVVKAQVHAGGRGKGTFDNGYKGGVKLCATPEEAQEIAAKMLGFKLTTKQTPPEGVLVRQLMVAESLDFTRELYLAILMDRASGGPVFVVSKKGGMDIEAVAEEDPEAIIKVPIDINVGPTDANTRLIAEKLDFRPEIIPKVQTQLKNLYNLFVSTDSTQVEINPFVEATDGNIYCIDAKINFDDNAEFRQKEIFALRDPTEEDPREVEASKWNLNYVGMDGNIGCMVNGAGLAMATMDIIQLHGGSPANFLDVGGGATPNQVKEAFRIVSSDSKVKAILVNIFGGIVKCDTIASGIITACHEIKLSIPLIVRLAGTNVDLGYKMLADSGLNILTAQNLDDAAKKAVASIQ